VIGLNSSDCPKPFEDGHDSNAEHVAKRAVGKLNPRADWDHLEITTAKQNDYSLKLVALLPCAGRYVRRQGRH
jgi:hypothetical protein